MSFNPNPNNQEKNPYFSRKIQKNDPQILPFNGCNVDSSSPQKHLGLVLDEKLSFDEHIQSKIRECNKLIGIIERLSATFPRNAL